MTLRSTRARDPVKTAGWINLLFGTVLIGTCLLAHTDQPGPPCIFQQVFHVPCPGCGLTRSFKAIWRGDVWLALRYHPLGPLYFGLCVSFLLAALLHKPLAGTPFAVYRLHDWLISKGTIRVLVTLMVGVWLIRISLLLVAQCGMHNACTEWLLC